MVPLAHGRQGLLHVLGSASARVRDHFDGPFEILSARLKTVPHPGEKLAFSRVHGSRNPSGTLRVHEPRSDRVGRDRAFHGRCVADPSGRSIVTSPHPFGRMLEHRPIRIRVARDAESVRRVAQLFREYADGLGFSLDFQDFDGELERLPGPYAPPRGTLLLAEVEREAAGCVGLRPLDPATCEMKRLYVRPAWRGRGAGRRLAERVIEEGRSRGYRRMRLDTTPTMTGAIALYRGLGFSEIPPYCFNPIPGALFFELRLR
jgi:putative acetyltransferase